MVYALLPFMVLPIYVSLEQMDKRLLEASSDLGATPLVSFRRITLPLTMPGVAAGSILVFIQNQFLSARDWPFGSALSIILAFLALIMILLYYRALKAQKGGRTHEEHLA